MRRTLLALLVMVPAVARTQATQDRQSLPRDVRREVVDRWNQTSDTTLRSTERLEIEAGREVRGDVAVRGGPLVILGHVTGSVLAINTDVTLSATARVDGDLLVVGGQVQGNSSRVAGTTRIYRQPLVYREDGNRIAAADDDATEDESWWRRLEHRHEGNWSEALRVVQAGPFNRVEGLPIELGPVIHRRTPWGSIQVDAATVARTAASFNSDHGDFGHDVRAEVRVGRDRGVGIGGALFSIVDPVELWQLSDLETALSAFVSRRDYRDYYQRHGGNAYVVLYGARNLSLTGAYGEERWSSRVLRNPFTIFNGDTPWRPNPTVDEGLFHIATTTLRFDTRTDLTDPWSGWYLNADVEYGRGSIASLGAASFPRLIPSDGVTAYTRGFFDFRRYNRLGPDGQLNVRAVFGGWLDGDPLPLERRVSVDGPGVLPGFDFRSARAGPDVGTCNAGLGVLGHPAECDRIALVQAEYRGDLRLDITSHWDNWPHHYRSAHGDVVWVVFADAGRGWRVGTPDGTLTYASGALPPLSTFRADVGLGLDIGGIGIYAAKSASTPAEPVNYFIRLRHRF